MLNYSEIEKFLHDIQELGLRLNEMKSNGETTISIEDYERLLQALINMTNTYQELEEHHDWFAKKMSKILGVTY